MEQKLVTSAEMAKIVSVSQWTIEEWGREGKIPRIVMGKKTVRYDPDEVIRAMKKRKAA